MKIVILDDEQRALNVLNILLKALGESATTAFQEPGAALAYLQVHEADLVFLDIEMPGMNGIEFARRLRQLARPVVIVFLSAYPQFALEAWDVAAVDYILKPYDKKQLSRALQRARRWLEHSQPAMAPGEKRVVMQCFPVFAVWVDGKPLAFSNRKAKELLAYLVHMQGAWVNIDRLIFALFGDSDEVAAKNYYRLVLHRLRQALKPLGLEDLIESSYGKVRLRREQVSCDYYRYLEGETGLYLGAYLEDYEWAEEVNGALLAEANARKAAGKTG